MMELGDIRAGAALATAGLLALSAWVWQDAEKRTDRLGPAWAAFVLLTGGLAVAPYLWLARGHRRRRALAGMGVWMGWMLVVAAGSVTVSILASRNREASTGVVHSAPGTTAVTPPTPSWGDFDKAFPPGASPQPPQTPAK